MEVKPNNLYFNNKRMLLCISRVKSYKSPDKTFPIVKDMATGENFVGNDDIMAQEGYKEVTKIIKVETKDG